MHRSADRELARHSDIRMTMRYTHITELLRNSASLVEARELARHSDIRMTMRYTHIGLDDQARAVAAIPAPRTPQADRPDTESWESIGSKTCGKPCHSRRVKQPSRTQSAAFHTIYSGPDNTISALRACGCRAFQRISLSSPGRPSWRLFARRT